MFHRGLSWKARRAWAKERLKGKGLARWFLWLISPLVISLFVYRSLDQQEAALAGWRIVLYTIVTFVGVTAVEWLLLITLGASLRLRDEAILRLDREVTGLRAEATDSGAIDVDIRIGIGSVYRRPIYRDYWLITFPTYIINHMSDRNVILRFGLQATMNGKLLHTHDDLFMILYNAGNIPRISRCLPNPKDASPRGNWGGQLGFLVRHDGHVAPTVQASHLAVIEEHTDHRYRIPIPGECRLASDSCIELEPGE